MKKILIVVLVLSTLISFFSCEKRTDEVKVTYRIIDFQDGFTVYYKTNSDTLVKKNITGTYTSSTPWMYSFMAQPGDIVYVSMTDTVVNSYSRVQILFNGKIFKEKSRTYERFMPVVNSGVIPFD